MNLRIVDLQEICEFLDNQRIPVTDSDRKPGPYPYYGANGLQDWIDGYIFDEPLVLLAEDGGHFGSKTKPIAYKVTGKCWVNNHAHVLRPKDNCDVDYLHHILSFYDVTKFINGTTREKLTKSQTERIPIPLPPLPEQKSIAAILEKVDRLRRQRRYALELSNTYLQSVFLEMFYEKANKDWPNVSIESLGKRKKDAIRTGPFGSQLLHSEFVDAGIVVLGIDNAVQNRFSWGVRRFITKEKYQQLKRYTVFPGDVIITIMGTPGRCAVIPDNFPLAINTKHLCCITLDQDQCLPDYLKFCFLTHPSVLSQLKVWEHGAVMPGLNMDIIKNLLLPRPPIPLQEKFIEIVHKFELLLDQQREAERQAEHLFQTLLHQAFEGNVGLVAGIGHGEPMKSSDHFSIVDYRLNGTSRLIQKLLLPEWHQPGLGLSME